MIRTSLIISSIMLIVFFFFVFKFSNISVDNSLVVTAFTILVIGNLIQTVLLMQYLNKREKH
jgi:hypothetical protein